MFKTAWRFIVFDKPKSIGALFGVVISIFLIGQQVGIFIFLTNAMSKLVDNIDTDIWVVDNKTTNVSALGQIDLRNLREIESIEGVANVYPLVVTGSAAKFENGKSAGITLVGAKAPAFVGGPWGIDSGRVSDLINEGAVSLEYFDSKLLGDAKIGARFEIGGKKAYAAIQTKGVRGFGASFVFTTIERARYYSKFPNNKISAVLVKLKPGADKEQVMATIDHNMVGVKAWTKEGFSKATVNTVLTSSGIALSVGTLIIFAILSGSVIIGLTLYSAATDRLRDYATLKAIGATNGYVIKLILIQAFMVALFGYVLGTFLMEMFRLGISNAGTTYSYTPLMYVAFAVVTLLISMVGAVAAIFRITKVEPASVFRG
jgi:putative ABC transport system permease protein